MRTLFSFPYLNVFLFEGPKPVLELQWLRYAAGADLRAAVAQVLQFSIAHRVTGWVADDRQQGAIRPRDLEWAEQEILGPLSAAGLERFAQLESLDSLNRRTVDAMYTRAEPVFHFEFRRFADITQARTWACGG